MKSFREIAEEKAVITEGLFQKGTDWLIKNTDTFEDLYINTQKNYGSSSIVIENPKETMEVVKTKGKYVYLTVKYLKSTHLCIIKDKELKGYEDLVTGDSKLMLRISSLKKLENNGIVPFYITRINKIKNS